MSHKLSLKVTAEGVETHRQLDFLCHNGCDEVQGFLLSPPIAAESIAEWLATPA